jgi:acetyltransferase-like isoleucine patch superfamily enzyme
MKRLYFYLQVLLGLPKSIYLNLYYFKWKGFLLPILVNHRTRLTSVGGVITLLSHFRFGCVRLGFDSVALSTFHEWNVWNVQGQIVFIGTARFGSGTKLFVGSNGVLSIGHNLLVTARSEIICTHKVEIGPNALFSWDILLMDTDSHPVRNAEETIINPDKPIIIGKNVWIGCRAMILKGAVIADDSIVASGTTVNKTFNHPNVIIAGNPARVVKENILWLREAF